MKIGLPYGDTELVWDFPAHTHIVSSRIGELRAVDDGGDIVCRAMEVPVAGPRLSALAAGKRSAVIIISDHTRPVPSRDILPHLLRELREGQTDIAVTLLVATGFHRGTTQQELRAKLGGEIMAREHIVVHDCLDASSNVQVGVLPSGAPLVLNRLAVEAELLIAEGFIEPHFFAGFSGGRKSVLPGICDRVTVLGNHCGAFIHSPHARTGVLQGNPLHRDMLAAADMAQLAYVVNVVIDEGGSTVAAFAGAHEAAHLAGCNFLRQYCEVPARNADIVVTTNGGRPLDQNIYQSVKGLTAAEACAAAGAVLIMCAECADGTGSEEFYRLLAACGDVHTLYGELANTPQQSTRPDQWEAQVLARVLMQHPVIFVTEPQLEPTIREMKMDYAPTIAEAMRKATALQGADASVTVIPNGISVIVRPA